MLNFRGGFSRLYGLGSGKRGSTPRPTASSVPGQKVGLSASAFVAEWWALTGC